MIGRRNLVASLVTAVVGLAGTAVGWAARGTDGLWSGLLALVLVLVFMSAGSLPFVVAGDARQGRGGLAFLVLGLTYALRLVLAMVLLDVAVRSHALDRGVIGLAVIADALAWLGAHVVLGVSRRHAPPLDV